MITGALFQVGQVLKSDKHLCSFAICRDIGAPSDSMARVRVSLLWIGAHTCCTKDSYRVTLPVQFQPCLWNHGQEIIFASVSHSFRSQHSYSQAS